MTPSQPIAPIPFGSTASPVVGPTSSGLPHARAASLDPAIQQILDDMKAFLGTSYASCNATASQDATSITETFSATDLQGNRFSYTSFSVGTRVIISPATPVIGPGQTQQFTASATDPSGAPIAGPTFVWSLGPGSLGTVDANGLYTAPATISVAITDLLTATLTGAISATTVAISLRP